MPLKKIRFSSLGITEHSNSNISITQINTTNARKIFLTSVYVEPRHDAHNTIRNFEYFLQKTHGSMHIGCGDFNGWHCDWGSPSCNRRGNQISNIISSYDLHICNIGTHPTYVTVTHSAMRYSIIDLTLVSDHSNINITDWHVHAGICPSSDHHAIKFNVSLYNITLTKNKRNSIFKYNTDAVNSVELQNPNSHNYFAAHIHNNLHHAETRGLHIKFNWVKAHIGIGGNEIADKEAKAAALLHKCPDHVQIPLSYIKYRNKSLSKQNADEYIQPLINVITPRNG